MTKKTSVLDVLTDFSGRRLTTLIIISVFIFGIYRLVMLQQFLAKAETVQGEIISRDNGLFSSNRFDIKYRIDGTDYMTWAIDPKRAYRNLQPGVNVKVLYDPSSPAKGAWTGSIWRMKVFPFFALSLPLLIFLRKLRKR